MKFTSKIRHVISLYRIYKHMEILSWAHENIWYRAIFWEKMLIFIHITVVYVLCVRALTRVLKIHIHGIRITILSTPDNAVQVRVRVRVCGVFPLQNIHTGIRAFIICTFQYYQTGITQINLWIISRFIAAKYNCFSRKQTKNIYTNFSI